MISDALKYNTTLTELNLWYEQKQQNYNDNTKIIMKKVKTEE